MSDSYERVIGERLPPVVGMLWFHVFSRSRKTDRYQVPAHKLEQQLRSEFEVDHNVFKVEVWTADDEGEAFTAAYERVPLHLDPIPLATFGIRVFTDPAGMAHLRAGVSSTEREKLRALADHALSARLGGLANELRRMYPELIFETEVKDL